MREILPLFIKKVLSVEESTAEAKAHPRIDIIEIKTVSDLQNIKNNLSATYVLANDIDLTGIDWEPIGDKTNQFTGKLYGLGHKITGLTINSPSECAGLFGSVSGGTIRDLVVDGAYVENTNFDSSCTGVIAGGISRGTIDNCAVINSTVQSSGDNTGGLTGDCESNSTIINSYSTSDVTGTSSTGGLVGVCHIFGGTIINSYSTGSVSGDREIGGLVGFCGGTITNSYSTGSVTGTSGTGGLAGDCRMGGTISNSYSTGSVSGTSNTGGLVGYIGTIQNSYSSGDVLRKLGSSDTSFGECYGYDVGPDWGTDPSTIENTYAKDQTGEWFGTTQENVDLINPITSSSMNKLNDGVGAGMWDLSGATPVLVTNNEKTHTSGGVNTDLIVDPTKPIYISSAGDLMKMKDDLSATYILTADIDLSGIDWKLICKNLTFAGKLYGCGHKITGLTINSTSSYTGLFGYTQNATIKDLQIDGANVTSTSSYTGTLVGCANTGTTIDNVAITNTTINGKNDTGGGAGCCEYNCTITNSYSTGNVSGTQYTGGLVGDCYIGSTITNSYSTADVEGTHCVGGCVGRLCYSSKLLNTYSLGSVRGTQNTGGLVGYIYGDYSYDKPQILNCYANGEVSRISGKKTSFGYLYGKKVNERYVKVANNYALKQVGDYFKKNQIGTIILEELTSDKMTSLNTATGDASANQWDMTGNYPTLKIDF